ncbi:SDR family NAD(P)-dependent oxidoreductase [Aspergillus homomorphus CBS 101889]|uniref:Short chain dehydrogenase n=1 Tax=Aspergillus homomorphus (strain CBS 101889) TaxID=1450537 RepID=A0A395I3K2_ASPHC|nr:short chain dehydrogenase [Aspergillus homomorphus CBS 101889]RAL14193.1 short chain dehydrogenase [Aspergillus homomorphus CBS 101889]
MTTKSLHGKNAIITGASRGIGRGIAYELASRGANLLLTYQNARTQADAVVSDLIQRHGVDVFAVQAQGSDIDAPRRIVQAAAERWGGIIDIIVNNAGAREDYPFEDMTHEVWEAQIATNLRFPIFLIREAAPYFGKAPRIVNFSSSYARDGHPGCAAYVACKGAIESVTRSLAKELGHRYNATVNSVSPGPVNTELWKRSIEDSEIRQEWDQIVKNTPAAPRVAEVDDIAQIVAFLVEETSRWVTGSVVNANGGLLFN